MVGGKMGSGIREKRIGVGPRIWILGSKTRDSVGLTPQMGLKEMGESSRRPKVRMRMRGCAGVCLSLARYLGK